jgi:adenylate cyclase
MENPDRLPRKLAAILYADVAGYSRLTGDDEDSTHRKLGAYLDLISGEVTRHGGKVMHYAGDAVLAMFDAVVDALLCAAQIQRSLEIHNADLPDERKVLFRIGVNLGDVIEDRGDIYGDGGNVAARLESLAEPGGICISESVHTAVGEKLPLTYEDQGEQTVKNIAKPVRVYRTRIGSDVELPTPTAAPKKRAPSVYLAAAAAIVMVVGGGLLAWDLYQQSVTESALAAFEKEAALPLPDEPSIAVLAFDNLSGDPEQEFFADGLSENIITRLASVTGMFVIARNSSFKYKGRQFDVRQVGKELGVRYVLEGSVQRAGGRIRVNAQLIDAITGNHLWAEKYDRELNDLFAVLDEITLKVVTQLEVQLTMGDHARLIAHGTDSVAALENQLLARKAFLKFDRENNLRSRELSRKATELDPTFAWAIAQEGWSYAVEALFGWSKDKTESLRQAESLARRALSADPQSPFAYSLLRLVHVQRGQLDEAIVAGRRAMELSPNDAYPLGLMSHLMVWVGNPEEAVVLINKALRLEPYPSATMLHFAGDAYHFSGRHDEAIPWYRKHLERQQRGAQAKMSAAEKRQRLRKLWIQL